MSRWQWLLVWLLIWVAALPVSAQVSVELALNQNHYMQYEPILARVRLRNFSGQPLIFGKNTKLHGELRMEVVYNRRLIPPLPDKDFSLAGLILMPGQTKEFVVPVNQYYRMTRPGQYQIHAYVRHAMLKDMFRSPDCLLEVTTGVEVWHRTVGRPDVLAALHPKKTSGQMEERSFSLRAMEERGVKYYYMVVEDKRKIYSVIRLGREIAMVPYVAEVDMLSRAHVIVPVADKLFRYAVINLEGRVEQQEMLKQDKLYPALKRNPNTGQVVRVGGQQAMPGVDYDVPGKVRSEQK